MNKIEHSYSFSLDGLYKLSEGSFGIVLASKSQNLAFKFFKILHMDIGYQQLLEMWAYNNLNHPGVMGIDGCNHMYFKIDKRLREKVYSLISNDKPCILDDWFVVMDLEVGILVYDVEDSHLEMITAQLLESVDYMHSMGVIHGDIKLNNILISKRDKIRTETKIIDYSLSHFIDQKSKSKTMYAYPYRPPEFLDKPTDTRLSDEWALGCVIFELITTCTLFSQDESMIEDTHRYQIENYSNPSPDYFDKLIRSKMIHSRGIKRLNCMIDSGFMDKICLILSYLISVRDRKSCSDILKMDIIKKYWNVEYQHRYIQNITFKSDKTENMKIISGICGDKFLSCVGLMIEMDDYRILIRHSVNNISRIRFNEREMKIKSVSKSDLIIVMIFMLEKMLVKYHHIAAQYISANIDNIKILAYERMIIRYLDNMIISVD